MFRKLIICLTLFSSILFPSLVSAEVQNNTQCSNRYLTLINPVRSRSLWVDKTLKPIQDQYNLVENNNFPATWLIQNDVLYDPELTGVIKKFKSTQEFGLLLEVSEQLAKNARVAYPSFTSWYNPKAVFLSGYTQSERRLLTDQMFSDFYHTFGYYPKSVGAWWIDSYSLQYMKDKYKIKSAMIVADQKTTDNYGIWGQWWGVPYYPAKANILTPASTTDNKLDVVIIQWAQRDLLLAHDEGPKSSNFSLQANDYIRSGRNTGYFKNLVSTYLDCRNSLGQVTVGLETGIESVGYLSEYENQLNVLKDTQELQAVTMADFATKFAKIYPLFPQKIILGDSSATWDLNTNNRSNSALNDQINYYQNQSFTDYFVADKSSFLNRNLLTLNTNIKTHFWFSWYVILFILFSILAYFSKKIKLWITTMLFITVAYGLVLRSNIQYDWNIYYSTIFKNTELTQAGLVVFSCLLIWLIDKWSKRTILKKSLFLYLIPLTFGVDFLLESIRYTSISERHFLGIMVDAFRMIGFGLKTPYDLSLVNQDFPSIQVEALLRFNFENIWNNLWLTIMVFPLAHIFLALIMAIVLLIVPKYLRNAIVFILIVLFILQIIYIFQADPRMVAPAS